MEDLGTEGRNQSLAYETLSRPAMVRLNLKRQPLQHDQRIFAAAVDLELVITTVSPATTQKVHLLATSLKGKPGHGAPVQFELKSASPQGPDRG